MEPVWETLASADVVGQVLDLEALALGDELHEVPIEIIPTSSPSSTTGAWRMRRSVISAMPSSTVVSGVKMMTGDDMTSRTNVKRERRPSTAIRRR